MARKKPITVNDLWQMERIGPPSVAPDGAHAVVSVSRHSMADNTAGSALWRVGSVATGVDAFRWCPDGDHVVFVSWVWPGLKGAKAQAKALKEFQDKKTTGYATSQGLYRYWDHQVPAGRVPHLHRMNLKTGKTVDLFEGTAYSLDWCEPDANCFDISPDGKRVVFAFDPAPEKRSDGRFALAEIDIKRGRFEVIAQDIGWDFAAPRYSPDGVRVAFLASHQALRHTMPRQLAVVEAGQPVEVVSAEWDHEVAAPLVWEDDGQAVLLAAEQQGQRHVWRFDLADRRAEVLVQGGTVLGFDKAAGTMVTVADAADHPAQCHVHLPGAAPRRIEHVNDALMGGLALGKHESIHITGAQGDPVQVWLFYPPDFDPKKRYPLLQVIHGGPHTAVGDNWHYRWNNALFAAGSGKKGDAGHVVAVVNYHGSSGFGYAFLDSITGRWGQLELQDIEAATTELLKRPYIDSKRVYAAGGSYGGYMVAWMNGHLPADRYAAYVCHAGCFDWTAMFADDAWAWHAKELGGWYWDDMARVNAQSPHAFAANMHTPTLVIHGALDYRVPDAQGLAYYNTLKARGVTARLLWFPDENHWILKPQNSQQWYGEFFDWLAAHPSPSQTKPPKASKTSKVPKTPKSAKSAMPRLGTTDA